MLLNCGVGEDSFKSPLESKEIKPVNPFKGNQPWVFVGMTDAEARAPILWPPGAKSWLTGKGPDAGKDWRREEKGTTEGKVVECYHQVNGREFEQTPVEDREAWPAAVHGVAESRTQLSDWTTMVLTCKGRNRQEYSNSRKLTPPFAPMERSSTENQWSSRDPKWHKKIDFNWSFQDLTSKNWIHILFKCTQNIL